MRQGTAPQKKGGHPWLARELSGNTAASLCPQMIRVLRAVFTDTDPGSMVVPVMSVPGESSSIPSLDTVPVTSSRDGALQILVRLSCPCVCSPGLMYKTRGEPRVSLGEGRAPQCQVFDSGPPPHLTSRPCSPVNTVLLWL